MRFYLKAWDYCQFNILARSQFGSQDFRFAFDRDAIIHVSRFAEVCMANTNSKKSLFFFRQYSRERGVSSGLLWMLLALFLVLGIGALLLRPKPDAQNSTTQAPINQTAINTEQPQTQGPALRLT